MQFHIPLKAEALVANVTLIGTFACVGHHMPLQLGHIIAHDRAIRALEMLLWPVIEPIVRGQQRLRRKNSWALPAGEALGCLWLAFRWLRRNCCELFSLFRLWQVRDFLYLCCLLSFKLGHLSFQRLKLILNLVFKCLLGGRLLRLIQGNALVLSFVLLVLLFFIF